MSSLSDLHSRIISYFGKIGKTNTQENVIGLRLSKKEKIFFLDSLGSLINAGIPIVRSLQTLYFQSENKKIREATRFLKTELEAGNPLAKTAGKLPHIFETFDLAMLEMGDATGKIGQVITSITEKEEKSLELSQKIRQALIYPTAIVLVAIAMVTVIMTYVIPKIETIYKEANTNLPALTKIVIAISQGIRDYGIHIAIGIFALTVIMASLLRNPTVQLWFDRSILKIPIFGELIRKKILVIFSEFLSALLSSGIPINKALLIVSSGLKNREYERQIAEILEEVKNGKPLSVSIGGEYSEKRIRWEVITASEERVFKTKLECFPIELSTAIKVGEQTGMLANMLEKTANRYNKEIDNVIKNLTSMLEPLVIVGIGWIVGVIVLAIMLPFFNMVNVMR